MNYLRLIVFANTVAGTISVPNVDRGQGTVTGRVIDLTEA
jgi:hypothetical protein